MGLLLSVLVFSVGVIEALSVYDRFTSGYLPLNYQKGRQHSHTITDVFSKFGNYSINATIDDGKSSTLSNNDISIIQSSDHSEVKEDVDVTSEYSEDDDESITSQETVMCCNSKLCNDRDIDVNSFDDNNLPVSDENSEINTNVEAPRIIKSNARPLSFENDSKLDDNKSPDTNSKDNADNGHVTISESSFEKVEDAAIIMHKNIDSNSATSVQDYSLDESTCNINNKTIDSSSTEKEISNKLLVDDIPKIERKTESDANGVDASLNNKLIDNNVASSKESLKNETNDSNNDDNNVGIVSTFENGTNDKYTSIGENKMLSNIVSSVKESVLPSQKEKECGSLIDAGLAGMRLEGGNNETANKNEFNEKRTTKEQNLKNIEKTEEINAVHDISNGELPAVKSEVSSMVESTITSEASRNDNADQKSENSIKEELVTGINDSNKQESTTECYEPNIEHPAEISEDVNKEKSDSQLEVSIKEKTVKLEEPKPEDPVKLEEPKPEDPVKLEELKPKDPVKLEEPKPEDPVKLEEPKPEDPVKLEEPKPEDPVKFDKQKHEDPANLKEPNKTKQIVSSIHSDNLNEECPVGESEVSNKEEPSIKLEGLNESDTLPDLTVKLEISNQQEFVKKSESHDVAVVEENSDHAHPKTEAPNSISERSDKDEFENKDEAPKTEASRNSVKNIKNKIDKIEVIQKESDLHLECQNNEKPEADRVKIKVKEVDSKDSEKCKNNEIEPQKVETNVSNESDLVNKSLKSEHEKSLNENTIDKTVDEKERKIPTRKGSVKKQGSDSSTKPKKTVRKPRIKGKFKEESGSESEENWGIESVSEGIESESESEAVLANVSTDDGKRRRRRPVDDKSASDKAFWLIFSGEYTKAMSKDWHSSHFCCWQCDESLTGQRYVLREEHPYCIKCYESVFANSCEECSRIIGIDSKDLSYKDKHWHEACFLCSKCRVSLVDKQFGSKADKIYCGNCYDAQFASRCDGCGQIFRAGTKKMEYKTRQWHEQCFCCCVCKTPIGTKSFIPREQEIYCSTCYEEKFATRCVKCNKIITSGGVTYKNEPWHRECFTCTNCGVSLAGQRFTSREDKPYCADCFGELFAKRCTACCKPITGIGGTRFISFEDRHWHNDCFICASCKTSLVGRGFITDGEDIICPECAKQKLI